MEDDLEDAPVANSGKDHNKDKVAVLAIAYHNMGVEQEFLRSYPAAILSYKKAVNFAEKHLGPEDGITQNLRSVYENAKNEVSLKLDCLNLLYSSTWLCLKREARRPEENLSRRVRKDNSSLSKI